MKTIDDLPKDAIATLAMVLKDWEKMFPSTPRQIAIQTFVECYFAGKEDR